MIREMDRSKTHYERLKNMYLRAEINKKLFPTSSIKIGEGTAEIRLTLDSKYHHGGGAVHGSIYFKLMDDAAYFASGSAEEQFFLLTESFRIRFLRPVVDGEIVCVGKVLNNDGQKTESSSVLYNQDGKVIGKGEGVFVRSRKELSKAFGYY